MNRTTTALITVDLQSSLVPGAMPEPVREALLGYLESFRNAGLPIVHALGGARILRAAAAGDVIDPILLPDPGARLYGYFLERGYLQRLGPNEVALHKRVPGAFRGTGLEDYLRARGVDTVLIAGCDFVFGPRAAALEANQRRFDAVLLEDAVSGMYALARAETSRRGVALRSGRARSGIPKPAFRRRGMSGSYLPD